MRQTLKNSLFFLLAITAMALTPSFAIPPKQVETSEEIWMRVIRDRISYFRGQALIVNIPRAQLEKEMQSTILSSEKFTSQQKIVRLSDLGDEWINAYYRFHPELLAQSKQQRIEKLKLAREQGVITGSELERWSNAVEQEKAQSPDRDLISHNERKVSLTIFTRTRDGKSMLGSAKYSTDEVILLVDVSEVLNQAGATMLWYGGQKYDVKRGSFSLYSCMIGVTCVPAPHWTKKYSEYAYFDEKLNARLVQYTKKLHASPTMHSLAQALSEETRRARQEETADRANEVPLRSASETPHWQGDLFALPYSANWRCGDTYTRQIKTLPNGGVLTHALSNNDGKDTHSVHVITLDNGRTQLQALPFLNNCLNENRLDFEGNVWFSNIESIDPKTQQATLCFYVWIALSNQAKKVSCENKSEVKSWKLNYKNQPILKTYARSSSNEEGKEAYLNLITRQTISIDLSSKLRHEAVSLTPLPTYYFQNSIDLGGELFWQADLSVAGVSPDSGKVRTSFHGGLRDVIWGNVAGNVAGIAGGDWLLGKAILRTSTRVFRVYSLSEAKVKFDLQSKGANYLNALARSAKGRLLAIHGGSNYPKPDPIELWDMKEGRALANLDIPSEYKVESVAFSWRGDRLFVLLKANDTMALLKFEIPAALHDSADQTNIPNQGYIWSGDQLKY